MSVEHFSRRLVNVNTAAMTKQSKWERAIRGRVDREETVGVQSQVETEPRLKVQWSHTQGFRGCVNPATTQHHDLKFETMFSTKMSYGLLVMINNATFLIWKPGSSHMAQRDLRQSSLRL